MRGGGGPGSVGTSNGSYHARAAYEEMVDGSHHGPAAPSSNYGKQNAYTFCLAYWPVFLMFPSIKYEKNAIQMSTYTLLYVPCMFFCRVPFSFLFVFLHVCFFLFGGSQRKVVDITPWGWEWAWTRWVGCPPPIMGTSLDLST